MQQSFGQYIDEVYAPTQEFRQRKFNILKQLGKGGQGCVYLAKCVNWGNYTDKENSVFEKEIDFLKILTNYQNSQQEIDYPCNMIQVFDSFVLNVNSQNGGQKFFITIMEKGEMDLYRYLSKRQQPLSHQEKIKICQDVTKPIYFLHQNKYIHRDIKPENYIKVADKFKLIDFGLVKQKQSRMTIGVGTPFFSAPEIVNQEPQYTEKVDIWSLACVFYEIFTSQPLFNCQTIPQARQKILNHLKDQNEVFIKINKMQCHQEIRTMIIQMLQPDAKNRISKGNIANIVQSFLIW